MQIISDKRAGMEFLTISNGRDVILRAWYKFTDGIMKVEYVRYAVQVQELEEAIAALNSYELKT